MREGVKTMPAPALEQENSSSRVKSKTSGAESPLMQKGSGFAGGKTKKTKKVMFTTPPKYKTKHSISGMMRKNRTALQTLQPNASNPKLLVGSGSPRIAAIGKPKKKKASPKMKQLVITCSSDSPLQLSPIDRDETHNIAARLPSVLEHKAVQTDETTTDPTQSIDYRMCTDETPPNEYWRVLAEQRRVALAETLEENEKLHEQVEKLRAQVSDLENQVKDTGYFAMMYKLASTSEQEIA